MYRKTCNTPLRITHSGWILQIYYEIRSMVTTTSRYLSHNCVDLFFNYKLLYLMIISKTNRKANIIARFDL